MENHKMYIRSGEATKKPWAFKKFRLFLLLAKTASFNFPRQWLKSRRVYLIWNSRRTLSNTVAMFGKTYNEASET